ncbi:MAG: hypothetical protein JRJ56_02525 [Deltaproteobacteria bacterium]|nr:hypothetical protein [Deltaproteobacteria bacterium]
MPLYFPDRYFSTPYRDLYRQLTPVERLRVLREFIGVTYERRFVFLRDRQSRQKFRNNIRLAARKRDKIQRINWLTWRHKKILFPYLRLVFRHYLLGFLVQMCKTTFQRQLPPSPPGCFRDTHVNLIVMSWMNRCRSQWSALLDREIGRVIEEGERHLYAYCLLAYDVARRVFSPVQLEDDITACRQQARPGRTPLGVEMEFSNLGRYATIEKFGRRAEKNDPFRNMVYYSAFFLDDLTWRLGGYVDTHVRGRRLFTLTRFGGFYEYSLVRVDYPRMYSLPLTTDPGIANAIIRETINFVDEIKPHSLHINIELHGLGEVRPELNDYLCLLMLGGDLGRDEQGRFVERRLANNELRGVIQHRKHLSLFEQRKKEVIEYSFMRLWAPAARDYDYFPLIMALKGFQFGYNLDLSCRDQVQGMLYWAQSPRPLPPAAIDRFVAIVSKGLRREGAHSSDLIDSVAKELERILRHWNRQLAAASR